jgi:hypothetical protein
MAASPFAKRALASADTVKGGRYRWSLVKPQVDALALALSKGMRPLMGRVGDVSSGGWMWLWVDGARHAYGR